MFQFKFRWGLSVNMGYTFIKIRWVLTEKVEADFFRWEFIPLRKLCNRTKFQSIAN